MDRESTSHSNPAGFSIEELSFFDSLEDIFGSAQDTVNTDLYESENFCDNVNDEAKKGSHNDDIFRALDIDLDSVIGQTRPSSQCQIDNENCQNNEKEKKKKRRKRFQVQKMVQYKRKKSSYVRKSKELRKLWKLKQDEVGDDGAEADDEREHEAQIKIIFVDLNSGKRLNI
jgi:hypothetical protein